MAERIALVTGATGFVGSHAAEALETAGWTVRCAVRSSSDPRWLERLRAQRVEVDLEAEASLRAAVRGAAVIVHAAGVTRAPHPRSFFRVNAAGTEALARAAAAEGVRRFVLVSSLAARGPDARGGGPPPADAPVSPYGRSKREAETRLAAVADEAGGALEAVALRPAGVYGPRDRDLLPLFRMAARGVLPAPAGRGALQPVYVEDVARAVLRAAEGRGGFGPYPIAAREVVDWPDVAVGLERALGRRVRLLRLPAPALVTAATVSEAVAGLAGRTPVFDRRRAEDLARLRWTCDPAEAESALGWRAEVRLEGGLSRTTRWYRERGWLRA